MIQENLHNLDEDEEEANIRNLDKDEEEEASDSNTDSGTRLMR